MNKPAWWPHGHESFMCPRRSEWDGPEDLYVSLPKHDFWIGSRRTERATCSWCGSLHPDVFMELARTGRADIGPTDKPYKAYVEGDHDSGWDRRAKFYFRHLSDAQREEFVALYNSRSHREYRLDMSGFDITKVGTSSLRIGYPGYFYVMPYFMVARVFEG